MATRGGTIADRESAARNTFRLGAFAPDDTPPPTVNSTQELDPSDILEVRDMAEVFARAEEIRRRSDSRTHAETARDRSSRSTHDFAESTPASDRNADARHRTSRPTDDIAGPATHAASSLVFTVPLPSDDDDAFYHPAGRIRSPAIESTRELYATDATIVIRARERRKKFSWVLGVLLVPLSMLAGIAIFGGLSSQDEATPVSTTTISTATIVAAPEAPIVPPAKANALVDSPSPAVAPPVAVEAAANASAPAAAGPVLNATNASTPSRPNAPGLSIPVVDVNSLPTARASGRSPR